MKIQLLKLSFIERAGFQPSDLSLSQFCFLIRTSRSSFLQIVSKLCYSYSTNSFSIGLQTQRSIYDPRLLLLKWPSFTSQKNTQENAQESLWTRNLSRNSLSSIKKIFVCFYDQKLIEKLYLRKFLNSSNGIISRDWGKIEMVGLEQIEKCFLPKFDEIRRKNLMKRIIENFGSKRANELSPFSSSFTFIDLKYNSKISA